MTFYLKYDGLVVLLEVEGKHVGIHKGLAAQTQDVDGFLQELNLDPRHVVLLHLLHLVLHHGVQLVLKLE